MVDPRKGKEWFSWPFAGDEDGGGRPDAVGSGEIALVESEAHLTSGVHIEEGPANGDVHESLDVGCCEGLVAEAEGDCVTESVTELAKFVTGDIGDQRAAGIVDGLARGDDAGVNDGEKYCAGGIVRRNASKKTRAFFDGKRRDLVGDVHDVRAGGDAGDDRFADGHGIVGRAEVGHKGDGGRGGRRAVSRLARTTGENSRDGDCCERKDAANQRAGAAEGNRAASVQHASSQFGAERHFFSGAHAKLAASLVSPEPLYLATCG